MSEHQAAARELAWSVRAWRSGALTWLPLRRRRRAFVRAQRLVTLERRLRQHLLRSRRPLHDAQLEELLLRRVRSRRLHHRRQASVLPLDRCARRRASSAIPAGPCCCRALSPARGSVAVLWLIVRRWFGVAAATIAGAGAGPHADFRRGKPAEPPRAVHDPRPGASAGAVLRSLESRRWWMWLGIARRARWRCL